MDALTLDREDFRQWLVAKEPDDVVGETAGGNRCPAASWLTDQVANATVGCFVFVVGDHIADSPPWLQGFVGRIDKLGFSRPVTAKKALEVLDSLDALDELEEATA